MNRIMVWNQSEKCRIEYCSIAERQIEDYDSHITYSKRNMQDLIEGEVDSNG